MIGFLTSFRARALAKDWDYHVWLLEQTIRSMLAQTEGEICVVVGCHDIPDTPIAREQNVQFVPVSCDPPQRTNDDMCVDKVLKLSAAAKWALGRGCDYVVFNDADDLVSNRIGAFVQQHHGETGWYTATEMFYTYGGGIVRRCDIPSQSSGPCLIVRADLLHFASPPFSGDWTDLVRRGGEARYLKLLERHGLPVNILVAVGLGHYREYMEAQQKPLAPLPFPANVVINHLDSLATVPGGIGSYHHITNGGSLRRALRRIRSSVRKLKTLRPMKPALRSEFGVPADASIPARYKRGGSLFWR